MEPIKVLIAGLAGASLGTELVKSLLKFDYYKLYGCDISNLAFGLYTNLLEDTFIANKHDYVNSIVSYCVEKNISFILPGGEQPTILLSAAINKLNDNGIILLANNQHIVKLFANKATTFTHLDALGFPIPWTIEVKAQDKVSPPSLPCIVKPAKDTGGSDSVFIASSIQECNLYIELLRSNNRIPIIQEYIDLSEGEFTVGVLSNPEAKVLGSIAMKRVFDSKLSVSYKGEKGLISSGYSQGLIADFKDIRNQAEQIARKSKSTGPLNIQGRVKNGILIPFEINPRFSASTYLRAMAGFDEVDFFIRSIKYGTISFNWKLQEGYYMRTFDQVFIPIEKLKETNNKK